MARGTLRLGSTVSPTWQVGGLERRRRKADQIEAGHHRGQTAEPAGERRRQRESRSPAASRRRRRRSERSDETKASDAEAVASGMARRATHLMPQRLTKVKTTTIADRDRLDRQARQIPLLDGRGREQRGQPAGRHPAPPVAGAGQRREHRAVGTEGLRAGRRDAADAVRPHQDELGPGRRRRPAEEEADDEQRHGRAALSREWLPWPTNSAVIRKIIWLLPPMARAVVPTHPSTRGWGGVTPFSQEVKFINPRSCARLSFYTRNRPQNRYQHSPAQIDWGSCAGFQSPAIFLLSGGPAGGAEGDLSPSARRWRCACRGVLTIHSPMPEGTARSW